MVTNTEIKIVQNSSYFALYHIKKLNEKAGFKVIGLEHALRQARVCMSKEDIALVEKEVNELTENA